MRTIKAAAAPRNRSEAPLVARRLRLSVFSSRLVAPWRIFWHCLAQMLMLISRRRAGAYDKGLWVALHARTAPISIRVQDARLILRMTPADALAQ